MTEIHLPMGGARALRIGRVLLSRAKRRGWRPIVGLGFAALFSLILWALFLAGVWVLN